ncbi:hypothetical protein GcC1_029033, partial [Golovinomyces cichoracearum]
MSDRQSSNIEPVTILGVNKKLNDSLISIANRFQVLERKLENSIENTNQRLNRAEKRAEGIEELLRQEKQEETRKLTSLKQGNNTDKDFIKRNKQGRLDISATSDISENLSSGEKFVKKVWPEAVFPHELDNETFTSAKNRVVLKPEWRLVIANGEIFTKLSNIQNALQMALIPYN